MVPATCNTTLVCHTVMTGPIHFPVLYYLAILFPVLQYTSAINSIHYIIAMHSSTVNCCTTKFTALHSSLLQCARYHCSAQQ